MPRWKAWVKRSGDLLKEGVECRRVAELLD